MRLDRLVSIITVLLRRQRVPARELAAMFEVSERTILRDVDAINLAGIPIVTWQGAGGGIGIADGYRLDRSVLTGDEMAALIVSLKGVAQSLGDPKFDILLDKLKNTIPKAQLDSINLKTSQIVIDMTPWGGNRHLKHTVDLLRKAIELQREVSFLYIDSDSNRTERVVQPYTLVLKGQSWYLDGWCALRQAFRLFKIVRIRDIKLLDAVFQRKNTEDWAEPEDGNPGDQRKIAVLLLEFDEPAESVVMEWFGDSEIERAGGKLRVRANLPENNWLYGFLLGFGPALEVLEPPHIRSIVAEMARQVNKKYDKSTQPL